MPGWGGVCACTGALDLVPAFDAELFVEVVVVVDVVVAVVFEGAEGVEPVEGVAGSALPFA